MSAFVKMKTLAVPDSSFDNDFSTETNSSYVSGSISVGLTPSVQLDQEKVLQLRDSINSDSTTPRPILQDLELFLSAYNPHLRRYRKCSFGYDLDYCDDEIENGTWDECCELLECKICGTKSFVPLFNKITESYSLHLQHKDLHQDQSAAQHAAIDQDFTPDYAETTPHAVQFEHECVDVNIQRHGTDLASIPDFELDTGLEQLFECAENDTIHPLHSSASLDVAHSLEDSESIRALPSSPMAINSILSPDVSQVIDRLIGITMHTSELVDFSSDANDFFTMLAHDTCALLIAGPTSSYGCTTRVPKETKMKSGAKANTHQSLE